MGRVNFLKKVYFAITDFRIYPYTQKERALKAIWFYLRLVFICAFLIALFMTIYAFDTLPTVIAKFDETVPYFEISSGELVTNEEKFEKIDSNIYLVFSKNHKSEEILDLIRDIKKDSGSLQEYDGYIFVLKDQASYVYDLDNAIYQAVKIDYSNLLEPTTKDSVVNDLTILESSLLFKFIVLFITTMLFFAVINIYRFMTVIIYALTIWLLNSIFALKLKFRNYVIIICYVSTLPLLLETIAIIVTKQISDAVNLICTLVSFVYIFYGLRAIKIDNILNNGKGNNPLEKLENAIKEAQEEIEEQLKEQAEKKREDKQEEANEEQPKEEQNEDEQNKENTENN